jgi:hypothetical protein
MRKNALLLLLLLLLLPPDESSRMLLSQYSELFIKMQSLQKQSLSMKNHRSSYVFIVRTHTCLASYLHPCGKAIIVGCIVYPIILTE